MTEAPERIWARADTRDGWTHGHAFDSGEVNGVAYTRADLVTALEDENQRLRESLQECLEIVERVSDKRAYRALKTRARHALHGMETSHD